MVLIIQKDNPILRKKAAEVRPQDITGSKIQGVLADMKTALTSQLDGVAIAAPQIGVSLRIFVISGQVFSKHGRKKITRSSAGKAGKENSSDLVFINPVLTKLSKEKKIMSEGCLSVRYLYGNVMRSTRATIQAYNEKGEHFERGASGLLAQIFQHETDHLNGVLFIDKAEGIEDMPPEDVAALQSHEEKHSEKKTTGTQSLEKTHE